MNKAVMKPELLMPAGSLETLKTAVLYGADAVYMGGGSYSLRAKADNFTFEEMREGISFAHERGVKVYLTVNIFAHNGDIDGIRRYFREIGDLGIDAVLVSDPGVFSLLREELPRMEVHISTQANNTNHMTFRFWHEMGAKRVVAARELSLSEIRQIRENVPEDLEIEAFIHGAMCISYSGRCLLSSYFTGRDANKGACTHPCRWKYNLVEEKRPGEYLPVEEDDRGTYILNSKDLCMIGYIPEMLEAGIYSFKIEGRMKTALYIAAAARSYRRAIDDYLREGREAYSRNIPEYMEEISACTYRQFTTGFYFSKPDHESQIYNSNTYIRNYTYLGTVISVDSYDEEERTVSVSIRQKNKFLTGDRISVMPFRGRDISAVVSAIYDECGNPMDSAPHPKQLLTIKLELPREADISGIREGVILRKREN